MIELVIIGLRLLQYTGAMVLFGSSLFFLYALPSSGPASAAGRRSARGLLIGGAALLGLSSALAIGAQASLFAGSFSQGFTAEAVDSVVSYMSLGQAALARSALATAALLVLIVAKPGRITWLLASLLGAAATGSLAWLGHGAATEGAFGWLHLAADIAHVVAAAAWLGALAAFLLVMFGPLNTAAMREALYEGLRGFAGTGSIIAAVLVLTGAINSWILVGPNNVSELTQTTYGQLLLAKVGLFIAMLVFAAANRFRHTPRLAKAEGDGGVLSAVRALRRSILLEAGIGMGILILVAWLGTLAPPGLD